MRELNIGQQSDLIEKVISINRVTKVTKGGKKLYFSALVVVGDTKGRVGFALDKANEVAEAIRKSLTKAKKSLFKIPLEGSTIPHEVIGKFGAASVMLKPASEGTGVITVNKKEFATYFPTATLQYKVLQPMSMTENVNNFDVKVNVYGGGSTGQAEAVRMALARVMCEVNAENRAILKPEGLLTRDPRMVERKKFGQKKARKRFQFSKR